MGDVRRVEDGKEVHTGPEARVRRASRTATRGTSDPSVTPTAKRVSNTGVVDYTGRNPGPFREGRRGTTGDREDDVVDGTGGVTGTVDVDLDNDEREGDNGRTGTGLHRRPGPYRTSGDQGVTKTETLMVTTERDVPKGVDVEDQRCPPAPSVVCRSSSVVKGSVHPRGDVLSPKAVLETPDVSFVESEVTEDEERPVVTAVRPFPTVLVGEDHRVCRPRGNPDPVGPHIFLGTTRTLRVGRETDRRSVGPSTGTPRVEPS